LGLGARDRKNCRSQKSWDKEGVRKGGMKVNVAFEGTGKGGPGRVNCWKSSERSTTWL